MLGSLSAGSSQCVLKAPRERDEGGGKPEEPPLDRIAATTRDPRGPQPPQNTTLALWIDLQCVGAAEAIEWLHRGRKSGFLRAAYRDHRKAVYLREGEVVFAESNQRIDRLGASLARRGVITLEELHAANREARPAERFGKTLVKQGFLEPRRLWDGIREQLEEIVWSITAYREGVLAFWEGEVNPDNLVRIDFNTRVLLERGVVWRRTLHDWIEEAREEGVRIAPSAEQNQHGPLEGIESHVLDALIGGARFDEVCRRSGVDPFTVARTLRLLEAAGRVELRRFGADPETTLRAHHAERSERTLRRLAAANQCLETLLQALEPYELGGLATRTREAFREIAARFPGAFADLSLTHQLLLPTDELEKRLYDASPELWNDAFEAIAALLDYVEFEVINHPQLTNSEALLEALHPLREETTR